MPIIRFLREIPRLRYAPEVLLGLGIAGSGFAAVTRDDDPASRDEWFYIWHGLTLLLIFLQGWLGLRSAAKFNRSQEEFKIVMFDQFGPVARQMTLMSSMGTSQRRVKLGEVLTSCTAAAAGLPSASRVRATVFQRDSDQGIDIFKPVPGCSHGRGDPPQSVFRRGDPEGDHVWAIAEADDHDFRRNIVKDPPPGFDRTRTRAYVTYITVPIRMGDELKGLLTINSPSEGDLTEDDVGTMRVLAALIGCALGIVGGRWPDGASS